MDHQSKLNLIVPDHPDISLSRQSQLLDISRASLYYQPIVNPEEIRIMGYMDKIFTDTPFYGSRKIQADLRDKPYEIFICREHVQRLMREMGLEAIYPKAKKGFNLSDPNGQHKKYPYLLKNLPIISPNQVWGTDITYIRLLKGFCYLVAIIDWYSRYVLAWTLSETLEIDFCLDNLKKALNINIPSIHNSDQGSHFTSPQYTAPLIMNPSIQISMDGRGRCMDNIFTERLWRSVKYENIYIYDYQNFKEAKYGIDKYFNFYNNQRKHQALDYRTPAQLYLGK